MRFRLFQYPLPADPELADLNAFLAGRKVATVSHHVAAQAGGAVLVFVVETVGNTGASATATAATPKIDYREQLTEDEFGLFSALRLERRRVAESEGIPVYAVFSNAQLAEMVRRRVMTTAAIGEIDGVGKARVEKYAEGFLRILAPALAAPASETERIP